MMNYDMTNPYEIAKYIKDAKKVTPVKVYVKGDLSGVEKENVKIFGNGDFWVLLGDGVLVKEILAAKAADIQDYHMEYDRRNSAVQIWKHVSNLVALFVTV